MSRQEKQRILMVLPLPPPVHGASLRNESIVISAKIQSTFNVSVIPMHFIMDNIEMGKFSLRKVFLSMKLYMNLVVRIVYFKPKLVYFNMATYGFALYRDCLVILISKAFRKKVIVHLRTQGIDEQSKSSKFKAWLFKWTLNKTYVVCLSKELSNDVKNVYRGIPIIINNGIAEIGCSKTKTKSGITFLFLSNFLRTKGVFDLLDAIAELAKKQISFKVIIAGKDADLTSSEIQVGIDKLKIEHIVKIVGPVYGQEKVRVFQESDVFVLPTTFEAFPGVLLEAMQFELPVISTREGAIPEIVLDGKTGKLIDKGDVENLAIAMDFYISNPKKITIDGKNGLLRFRSKFTMEIFENSMVDLFNSVAFK